MRKTSESIALRDSFAVFEEYDLRWTINESDDEAVVDGQTILARAVGPFFLVDGVSKNNRFYSRKLWERALAESQEKVNTGMMLGTIGHEQDIDDKALREGKISHAIRRLWIEDFPGKPSVGMGELVVLNTEAGRNLNTYLRSGAKLPVSSRAFGRYTGERYSQSNADIVDADTFDLNTFDYVTSPGVDFAVPVLVESTESAPPGPEDREDCMDTVSKEVFESTTKEKIFVEQRLTEALAKNSDLQKVSEAQTGQIESLKKSLQVYESLGSAEHLKQILVKTRKFVEDRKVEQAHVGKLTERLERYHALGSPKELDQVMERVNHLMDAYEAIGTPGSIAKALDSAYKLLKEYAKIGSPHEVRTVFRMSERLLGQMRKLGSTTELRRSLKILESYMQLGTPMQIRRALRAGKAFINKVEEQYTQRAVVRLSKRFGLSTQVVESTIQKVGVQTAAEILREFATTDARQPSGLLSTQDRYGIRESYPTHTLIRREEEVSRPAAKTTPMARKPQNRTQLTPEQRKQRVEEGYMPTQGTRLDRLAKLMS